MVTPSHIIFVAVLFYNDNGHPPLSAEMCSQPGSTGAELMIRTHNLKTGVFTAETGEHIDHCTR